MPTTFICSAGTSAAKGFGPPGKLAEWVRGQPSPDAAARALFEKVKDVRPVGDALYSELSAEVHSLVRMDVSSADRVVLLCSATPDGEVCAGAVRLYLAEHFAGIEVAVEVIAGLQVHDADSFRRDGVVNYVKACLKAVNDFGAANAVLNPTAGFKALVPYTVLVGMLKRVPCRYIFEQSTAVLTLPPLPVAVDHGPFERYRAFFEEIERNSDIAAARWNAAVRHDDRESVEPLIERIGGRITLSGVGVMFLDELRTPTALVPFLSRTAWEECLGNLRQLAQCDPFRFLRRVASDPNAFKQAEHVNAGGGLRWLKPGNTTDRYLVSVEGWRMLVWRAIREDEVGPDYPQRVKADTVADRSRLGPFTRMEFADEPK